MNKVSFTVLSVDQKKRYKIAVKEEDMAVLKLSSIKKNIAAVSSIPAERQLLYIGTTEVGDEHTCLDLGLQNGSILTLYTKPDLPYSPASTRSLSNTPRTAKHIIEDAAVDVLYTTQFPPRSSSSKRKSQFMADMDSYLQMRQTKPADQFSPYQSYLYQEPDSLARSTAASKIDEIYNKLNRHKNALDRRGTPAPVESIALRQLRDVRGLPDVNDELASIKADIIGPDRSLPRSSPSILSSISLNEPRSQEMPESIPLSVQAQIDRMQEEIRSLKSQLERTSTQPQLERNATSSAFVTEATTARLKDQLKAQLKQEYDEEIQSLRSELALVKSSVSVNASGVYGSSVQHTGQPSDSRMDSMQTPLARRVMFTPNASTTWTGDQIQTPLVPNVSQPVRDPGMHGVYVSSFVTKMRTELLQQESMLRTETTQLESLRQIKEQMDVEVAQLLSIEKQEVATLNTLSATQSDLKRKVSCIGASNYALKDILIYLKLQQRKLFMDHILRALSVVLPREQRIRRHLHNSLEEIKGSIRVIVRMRPLLPREKQLLALGGQRAAGLIDPRLGEFDHKRAFQFRDEQMLNLNLPAGFASQDLYCYDFYRVFDETKGQAAVFSDVSHLLSSALDGYNVCIMAYGCTGSGKTFTLIGDDTDGEDGGTDPYSRLGLLPRSIMRLFELLQTEASDRCTFTVSCAMIELYLDNILDLLSDDNYEGAHQQGSVAEIVSAGQKLQVRQSAKGETFIQNLAFRNVHSAEELMGYLGTGLEKRHIASTKLNDYSSRSHTLFLIELLCTTVTPEGTMKRTKSVITFADLAGSENVGKSQSSGIRFKEAQHINSSLCALGDVICSLSKKRTGQTHIPYRNNKLTMILQPSLGNNCKTLLFANISPLPSMLYETISTLNFASRVKTVKNVAIKNMTNYVYRMDPEK